MATRAYLVRFLSDNEAELMYNHFDGGEHLNKALNNNNIDPEEIFENPGHIRFIDMGGSIERYEDGDPLTVRGKDLKDIIEKIVDKSKAFDYLQIYDGMKDEWVMSKAGLNHTKLMKQTLSNIINETKMENKEFDYKKYLSNNPLLEGEVEENTFDPEVARGINSDVRKALDSFYENGDGLELAYAIEGIMFGNYNEGIEEETVAEEEISEMSEKEAEKISDEIEDLADDEELGNLDKVVSAYLKKHPNHKEMETKIRQIASRFVD